MADTTVTQASQMEGKENCSLPRDLVYGHQGRNLNTTLQGKEKSRGLLTQGDTKSSIF